MKKSYRTGQSLYLYLFQYLFVLKNPLSLCRCKKHENKATFISAESRQTKSKASWDISYLLIMEKGTIEYLQ